MHILTVRRPLAQISTAPTFPPFLQCQDLIARAQGILLDWDGCVAVDNHILPGARRFIGQYPDRIAILTNNSTHLPEDIAALLADISIHIPTERIITAGVEAVRWAVAQGHDRTMLLGSKRLRGFAREQGLDLVNEQAELVLLMRDTRFTYRKLERAVNMIRNGARFAVANADLTHPGIGNRIVPETGALLAVIQACVPDATPMMIGKPAPLLFQRALAVLGITPDEAVMVGDNPETDIAGARALGMASILIGGDEGAELGDLLL